MPADSPRADAPQFDPTALLNYGVLGLILLAILIGWLWAKPAVDRLIEERDQQIARLIEERNRVVAERDRAAEQRDAMAQVLQDRLLPVIAQFVSTTQALLPVLQEIQRLARLIPVLEELVRIGGTGTSELPPPARRR